LDVDVLPSRTMHHIGYDLQFALRMLRRNPGVTVVALVALGLGIGANSAVFTVLNGVLLRPLPFPQADRLLMLSHAPAVGPFGPSLGMVEHDYLDFLPHNQAFERLATFNQNQVTLTGVGEAARLPAADVTTGFLSTLRVAPAIGRDFRGGEENVVLIADGLWHSRFRDDRSIVGRTIKLDGVPHTILGVMPRDFHFPYDAQIWKPFVVRVNPHLAMFRPVVGRLKAGASRAQAQAEFLAFARAELLASPPRDRSRAPVPRVVPLKDLLVGDVRESLRIFAGAVAFVLLIACANVANLLLMRAESRRQEMSVRVAMGAGRLQLVRQLLAESVVVSLLGGAAGLLFALWGVPALLALAPEGRIPRLGEIHIDAAVLVFTFGVSLLTGLLFGAAPALHAIRRTVNHELNSRSSAGAGGGVLSALVVAEIALALVLLTGAGLMVKSLWRLQAIDPGFRPQNVVAMTVTLSDAVYREPADITAFHDRVLEKLAAIPGISAAAAVNSLPLGGTLTRGDMVLENRRFPAGFAVDKLVVSANYFRAMGIRVLSGRDFSDRDTADAPRAAVISQSAARTVWPGEDPLGKRISEADRPKATDWYTIVGVVSDVRQWSLAKTPSPALYFPYRQSPHAGWLPQMTFVARTAGAAPRVAPAMRAAVREVDADQPIERMASMPDVVAATGAERAFQARLLTAFAVLALALAVIGVYGVLAYAVAARTREIGIRMALGAQARDVLGMILRRTSALAAGGLAFGTAGALFATRVLEKMLFEVTPHDAPTMIAVGSILGLAAIAAGWLPARRASRVDPMIALRWE